MNLAQALGFIARSEPLPSCLPALAMPLWGGWPIFRIPVSVRAETDRDTLFHLCERIINERAGRGGMQVKDVHAQPECTRYTQTQVTDALCSLAMRLTRIGRIGKRNHYRYIAMRYAG